jgi:hypothetical protein
MILPRSTSQDQALLLLLLLLLPLPLLLLLLLPLLPLLLLLLFPLPLLLLLLQAAGLPCRRYSGSLQLWAVKTASAAQVAPASGSSMAHGFVNWLLSAAATKAPAALCSSSVALPHAESSAVVAFPSG